MTDIQERSSALMTDIFKNRYYLQVLDHVLAKSNMTVADIGLNKISDKNLVYMWNDFWETLPDTSSIRREPFFKLCDLCEEEVDD